MKQRQIEDDKFFIAGFFLMLGVAGCLYYLLSAHELKHSAALFVGIASAFAVGLSLIPRSSNKSATGIIVMGMLIALILSMFFFQEGLVCILMATPLFLSVGVSVGQLIDKSNSKSQMRVWLVLLFLPLSMEGVTEELSFNRHETVIINRVVALSPNQVEQKLARVPDLSQTLPAFLQLGFPAAQNYSGEGLEIGSERCFHVPTQENLSGDVCWTIEQRSSNHILFRLVKDESKIAHWMTWQTARVEWSAEGNDQRDAGSNISIVVTDLRLPKTVSKLPLTGRGVAPRDSLSESTVIQLPPLQRGGQTRVTVTLKFWRELDPAWYFSPLERYAVGLTGDYLIGAYFGEE